VYALAAVAVLCLLAASAASAQQARLLSGFELRTGLLSFFSQGQVAAKSMEDAGKGTGEE